mmetsp:Transcript_52041/g.89585  ORF Transcript_52041/g.89585 Transcript_52041/m.89585 type:complete len:121 (+) Transcript_52041:162-524(+)
MVRDNGKVSHSMLPLEIQVKSDVTLSHTSKKPKKNGLRNEKIDRVSLISRCEHEGCTKNPNFNNEGEGRGRFCEEHRQQGMVDVEPKKCEHARCKKRYPSFNFEGARWGRFCANHKKKKT